jgi:hemerythrin superfamily protein
MARTQDTAGTEKGRARAEGGKASSLLKEDHQRVLMLFKEYENLKNASRRRELAETICTELTVHAEIEEAIFYPAMRAASKDPSLVNEAEVEHASAKQLITEIESMQPDDELYDAKVKVLGEYVRHHVQEEEKQMFPAAGKAGIDTSELADELMELKETLQAKLH